MNNRYDGTNGNGYQPRPVHGNENPKAPPRRAQPAEEEGVDFGFDDRSVKVSQEAYSIFLERERHHLAALSAVTAERDQLRAEVEELRVDAERLDWLDGYIVSADSENTGKIAFSSSMGALRECVDAAMAAKEA